MSENAMAWLAIAMSILSITTTIAYRLWEWRQREPTVWFRDDNNWT